MLDIARQHTFIRLAATTEGLSARQLAEQAGFAPGYGGRLLKRHAKEIERRRRKAGYLGKQPRLAPHLQDQLFLELARPGAPEPKAAKLRQIEPERAIKLWRRFVDELYEVQQRWRDPSQLDGPRAARELVGASNRFSAATATAAAVFQAHGQPVPSDLLARPGGSEAGATRPHDPKPSAGTPAEPAQHDPFEGFRPRRCRHCNLLLDQSDDGGYSIPDGTCPNCWGGATIVTNGRGMPASWVRDLMNSGPEKVLARATWEPAGGMYRALGPRRLVYDWNPLA